MKIKINILKLSKRKILLALFFLIVLTTSVFVVPKAYSYYQASQIEHQGDILLVQSQYQGALEKYEESQSKWNNAEINKKMAKTQVLAESEESYKIGLEAFNNEEYEKAIEAFLSVSSDYKNYDKARGFFDEAKEKLKEAEKVKVEEKVKDIQALVQTSVNTNQKQSFSHKYSRPATNYPTSNKTR